MALYCTNCEEEITTHGAKFCPLCGTEIVFPDIEYNVFSHWRGGFSTKYGGYIPFSKEGVIAAEKNHHYGDGGTWLGSYKSSEITHVAGTEFSAYKILTWEKITWDNGELKLEEDNIPEKVHVTYLE